MFNSESHTFDKLGENVLASAYLVIATKLHFLSFIASKENALKSDLSPEKQLYSIYYTASTVTMPRMFSRSTSRPPTPDLDFGSQPMPTILTIS
jgi:hypothetical protein